MIVSIYQRTVPERAKGCKTRLISVVIRRKAECTYYVVTARDSDKKGESLMKKKELKIPEFKSIEEEAEFWDTHSLADYWDKFDDVKLSVDLKKPRDDMLILRLQKELKQRLNKIAKNNGLDLSTLARMWLIEKLQTYHKL